MARGLRGSMVAGSSLVVGVAIALITESRCRGVGVR